MTRTAEIGTISHGTMLSSDLISAFMSELEDIAPEAAAALSVEYADILELDEDAQDSGEDASWLVDALFDALNAAAPASLYFGAIDGDGSDYGFWPLEDES